MTAVKMLMITNRCPVEALFIYSKCAKKQKWIKKVQPLVINYFNLSIHESGLRDV